MSDIPPGSNAAAEPTVETIFLSPRVLDESAFERFSQTLRELVERARQERSNLESMVRSAETAGPRMERLAESQRIALKAAGDAGRKNEEIRGLLTALDERLERAHQAEAGLKAHTTSLQSTMSRAEAMLARAEHLMNRLDNMNTSVECAENAATRANESRLALEAAATRAEEVVNRTERSLAESLRAAQEAAGPLTRDLDAAGRASRELRAAADQCRSMVDDGERAARSIREALAEVESWRGVLIDAENRATLPPALRSIVEELRTGAMRDIAEMARVMRQVADRALAVERKPIAGGQGGGTMGPEMEEAVAVGAD